LFLFVEPTVDQTVQNADDGDWNMMNSTHSRNINAAEQCRADKFMPEPMS